MRIFTACLSTETNTYVPIPTCTDDFAIFRPGADGIAKRVRADSYSGGSAGSATSPHPCYDVLRRYARTHAMARPRAAVCATVPLRCHAAQVVLKDLRAICSRAAAEGFEVVEGLAATAPPSGTVRRDTYEAFKQEILAQCSAALPVDGVVLGLHGAMVAHGYDDVEGDLLSDVRALVGVECVIGVEFDPHMHLTQRRFDNADILIAYKEFPHVDMIERAEEVVDLTLRTIHGTTFTTTRSHNNYPRSHLT